MSAIGIVTRSAQNSPKDPNFGSVSILWPMTGANNGTTFTDITGNTITRGGATPPVTSTAQSKFEGSSGYLGDGGFSTAYLTSPIAALLGGTFCNATATWTIEAWIYLNGYPDGAGGGGGGVANGIGDQDAGSGYGGAWGFGVRQTGAIAFSMNASPYQINGSSFLFTGQWYFITAVANSGALTLYLNGVSDATGSLGTVTSGSTSLFQVGGRGGTSFPGYMYDLRITNGVARYSSNFTPPTAPFPTS